MQAPARDAVAAVFSDPRTAEAAVERLTAAGVPLQAISIVGKGPHAGERVAGIQNRDGRVKAWGSRRAFWGGLSALPLDGVLLTIPPAGPVVVLGYLATAVSAVDGVVVVGGLGGLAGIDAPRDSVLQYESAIASDGVLVLAHGTATDLAQAEHMLKALNPTHLELHPCGQPSVLSADAVGRLAGMLV